MHIKYYIKIAYFGLRLSQIVDCRQMVSLISVHSMGCLSDVYGLLHVFLVPVGITGQYYCLPSTIKLSHRNLEQHTWHQYVNKVRSWRIETSYSSMTINSNVSKLYQNKPLLESWTIYLPCTRLSSDRSLPRNDTAGEVDLGCRPSGHTTSGDLPQCVFKTVLPMRARMPPLPHRTLRTQMDEMPKNMQ